MVDECSGCTEDGYCRPGSPGYQPATDAGAFGVYLSGLAFGFTSPVGTAAKKLDCGKADQQAPLDDSAVDGADRDSEIDMLAVLEAELDAAMERWAELEDMAGG